MSWTIFLFFLHFSLSNFGFVENVDRQKFKTCQQSGFCRSVEEERNFRKIQFFSLFISRQRNLKFDRSSYEVDLNSLKIIDNGHFQFDLIENNERDFPLVLEIFTLELRSVRVKINEKNSLRKRFEPKESLVRDAKQSKSDEISDCEPKKNDNNCFPSVLEPNFHGRTKKKSTFDSMKKRVFHFDRNRFVWTFFSTARSSFR